MNTRILLLLVASLGGSQAWASGVTIPNTFTDGTTASASEVNSNFDSIESAININDSRVTINTSDINTNAANISTNTSRLSTINTSVGVLVNGTRIGSHLDTDRSNDSLNVLIDTGYIVSFALLSNNIKGSQTFYVSTDCSGQAYARFIGSYEVLPHMARTGMIFKESALNELYFVPAGSEIETNISLNSVTTTGGGCDLSSIIATSSVKVYANDTNITGVSLSDLTGDLTLGY